MPDDGQVSGPYEGWEFQYDVTCVSAPCCAFTFDAGHTDEPDGGYSCPACEALDLQRRIDEALALPVRPWSEDDADSAEARSARAYNYALVQVHELLAKDRTGAQS